MDTIKWDGKQITKPGLYSNVPLETYHKQICDSPSVSSSGLRKLFSESPAHFYCDWSGNPDRKDKGDEKQHFTLGRATHHLMLGEPFFAKLFAVQPDSWTDKKTGEVNEWRRGKGGVLFADEWRDRMAAQGRAVLKIEHVEQIKGMASALSKHPIVKAGALNGLIERSIFFKDKETSLWIKVRPDAIPTSGVDFVDLKTTQSVQWYDLQKTIFEYGYHQQGALVRRAAREVLKIDRPTFTLIFVESKEPYCVRVVTLKDNDLDRGEQQNRASLDTIARCLKSKHWPGPGGERDDAIDIELPEWAQKQIDDRLKFGNF